MHNKKTWFITGAGSGLGLALVEQLLVRGDQVAATTRFPKKLADHIRDNIPTALEGNFLLLQTDLTDETAIAEALADTYTAFGRIDVVINNAGYALEGALEELEAEDIHQCFAINTTASMTVMYKVMPYLRQQRAGYILNIAGLTACAAASDSDLYAATKYATLGLSEILTDEAKQSGISITVAAPAAFQTWLRSREYDALPETDLFHTTANLIRLADQTAPTPILLVGGDPTSLTTIKNHNNEIQFSR